MSKYLNMPKLKSLRGFSYEFNYFYLRALKHLNIYKNIYLKKETIISTVPPDLNFVMDHNYHEFLEDFEMNTYITADLGSWAYDQSKKSVAHYLYALCDLLNAKAFLEIGTYLGTSTMAILNLMHRRKRDDFLIITIDIEKLFNPERFSHHTQELLNNYTNNVHFIIGDSADVQTIARVNHILRSSSHNFFDLVFIDGLHIPFQIVADFFAYQNLVRAGGVILFDDLDQYFDYECFWAPSWPVLPIMKGVGRELLLTWTRDTTPSPHLIGAIQKY